MHESTFCVTVNRPILLQYTTRIQVLDGVVIPADRWIGTHVLATQKSTWFVEHDPLTLYSFSENSAQAQN